jgi:hypothetical protein
LVAAILFTRPLVTTLTTQLSNPTAVPHTYCGLMTVCTNAGYHTLIAAFLCLESSPKFYLIASLDRVGQFMYGYTFTDQCAVYHFSV